MATNDTPQDAKVFDIAKPGKTPPPETSRPTIVGHKPLVGDPMVTSSQAAEPTAPPLASGSSVGERVIKPLTEVEAAKPAKIGDTIIDIKAGSAKASPPPAAVDPTTSAESIEVPEVLTTAPEEPEFPKSKPVLLPDSELETPPEEPKSEPKPEPEPKAPEEPTDAEAAADESETTKVKVKKVAKAEPAEEPATPEPPKPTEPTEQPPTTPEQAASTETKPAEKAATPEAQTPTPSETAAASASVNSAAEAAKAAATPEPEVDTTHVEELIAQKKYFVKIGQRNSGGSTSNAVATGILLGLLVVLGIAAAWDAGYINVGTKAPFDFITDKAP